MLIVFFRVLLKSRTDHFMFISGVSVLPLFSVFHFLLSRCHPVLFVLSSLTLYCMVGSGCVTLQLPLLQDLVD